MVIVRISPGLANSIYEFAAGYALSRKLKQGLVLDISECVVSSASSRGYSLDYFNIPDVKKLVYGLQDIRHIGHEDVYGIPEYIRGKNRILVENENEYDEAVLYKSIFDVSDNDCSADIYMCGYFFPKDKYYEDYWEDIRSFFTVREKSEELKQFENLIEGKVSVGIHIRRGDMLFAGWATSMQDDYYIAAMEAFREKFGECIFCVFSDDIDYAKKIIGKDKTVYYVHYVGYNDAALDEFVSLSMCTHRILSNSSTFSRLADELNGGKNRKCFWQGDVSQSSSLIKSFCRNIRFVKNLIKQTITNRDFKCEDLCIGDEINWSEKDIRLGQKLIKKYRQVYKADNIDNIVDYDNLKNEVLSVAVDESNCNDTNSKIARLSLNVYNSEFDTEQEFFLQKFYCYYFMKKFDNALQLAFAIYASQRGNKCFMHRYIDILLQLGYLEEAMLEASGCKDLEMLDRILKNDRNMLWLKNALSSRKKHFILVPYAQINSSDRMLAFEEIGMVLAHLGHNVTFLAEPANEISYKQFIDDRQLKNRQGVKLICEVVPYGEAVANGVEKLYSSFSEDEIVVISRKKEVFADKDFFDSDNLKYIYWDYSFQADSERLLALENLSMEEEMRLIDSADYVMTTKANTDSKFIVCDEHEQSSYGVIARRWDFGMEHRFNKNYIYAIAKMMDRIK
ncbi:alpha-1,2-fucosyltransferase [Schwartzia succinivorans]|jgi:hypothetical protein|uniref:Glycosyl transferase family 11 n=1 Tax=Schwartzia succinivorans DSM 10502 TaxID=1123243 RepID=A0A1M4XQ70_9FIRM|nr:alpha-1,2-fucosyltransferase [Schwartzia succinivorans]SHE95744.1 Glycosyl transferase family 11 [Schwartzia succinivorans DSM 10502]